MFAPRYFAQGYFAPRYFPPGLEVVEDAKKGGIAKKKLWRFEEDLPYPITVEELHSAEDRLILQAYLDSLRRTGKEQVSTRQAAPKRFKVVGKPKENDRVKKNNDTIILLAMTDLI